MDSSPRGVRTSEFGVTAAAIVFAGFAGLTIENGVVDYAIKDETVDFVKWIFMTYIGARGGKKIADALKKQPDQPQAPPPTAEEVAKEVINQISNKEDETT